MNTYMNVGRALFVGCVGLQGVGKFDDCICKGGVRDEQPPEIDVNIQRAPYLCGNTHEPLPKISSPKQEQSKAHYSERRRIPDSLEEK